MHESRRSLGKAYRRTCYLNSGGLASVAGQLLTQMGYVDNLPHLTDLAIADVGEYRLIELEPSTLRGQTPIGAFECAGYYRPGSLHRRSDQQVDELVAQTGHGRPRVAPRFPLAVDPASRETSRGMDGDVLMNVLVESLEVASVASGEEQLEHGPVSSHGDLLKHPSDYDYQSIPSGHASAQRVWHERQGGRSGTSVADAARSTPWFDGERATRRETP
jgi:hypothetical protein